MGVSERDTPVSETLHPAQPAHNTTAQGPAERVSQYQQHPDARSVEHHSHCRTLWPAGRGTVPPPWGPLVRASGMPPHLIFQVSGASACRA
jgi:hypothetical protein